MTAQPIETDTLIDIAALVGEMEAPACESLGHDENYVHGGEATHYVRVHCPACGLNTVKAYCGPFVAYIVNVGRLECSECTARFYAIKHVKILGPVSA